MEIIVIVFLIVLAILFQEHRTLSGMFIFISGLMALAFGLTTNTITGIANGVITYAPIDPLITWAIGLALIAISVIHFLNSIDRKEGDEY
jgi:hypothetical protein